MDLKTYKQLHAAMCGLISPCVIDVKMPLLPVYKKIDTTDFVDNGMWVGPAHTIDVETDQPIVCVF